MPTAINKIVDGFLFPMITPIIGAPEYKTIAEVHLKFNWNAASVQLNLGWGTLVLLQLTVSPAIYATLSYSAFIAPVNPGAEPTITSIVSVPHITKLCYAYDVATAFFNNYSQTNKALRQILIAAVNTPLCGIRHHHHPHHPVPYVHNLRGHFVRQPARQRRQTLSTVQRQLAYQGINRSI